VIIGRQRQGQRGYCRGLRHDRRHEPTTVNRRRIRVLVIHFNVPRSTVCRDRIVRPFGTGPQLCCRAIETPASNSGTIKADASARIVV
jgi:hypothetical protein